MGSGRTLREKKQTEPEGDGEEQEGGREERSAIHRDPWRRLGRFVELGDRLHGIVHEEPSLAAGSVSERFFDRRRAFSRLHSVRW